MGEAHDAVADGDDLGTLGLRQRVVARHRVHDGERRLAHRRGDREGPRAWRGGRPSQPGADERVERHRQPLAGLQAQRSRLHRAAELEREERVPARELVHVMEDRAGRHPAEPELQQALDGAEAERGQVEAVEAIGGPVEAERRGRRAGGPLREQQADAARRPGAAPRRRAPRRWAGRATARRRRRRRAARARQGAQRGRGWRARRPAGPAPRRASATSSAASSARRCGAGRSLQRLGVRAEQVAERGVGEARLRLGGTRGDRPHARRLGASDRRLPERRLADPRLARDQQRARSAARRRGTAARAAAPRPFR